MDWNLKSLYGTQPSKTIWLTIFRAGPWHKVSAVAWNSFSEKCAHALGSRSFPNSLCGSVQHEIPARWEFREPHKSMLPSLTPLTHVHHSTNGEKGCPPTGVLLPYKTSVSCPKLLQSWAPAGVLLSVGQSSFPGYAESCRLRTLRPKHYSLEIFERLEHLCSFARLAESSYL